MKKIFNNSGMTLVEVIVASVILAIIAIPILSTMLQTTKFNVDSDVELRMTSEIQQRIENIKATGLIGDAKWFDRTFKNEVDASSPRAFYKLYVDNVGAAVTGNENEIDTDEQYDRWDYTVEVTQKAGSSKIEIYKAKDTYVSKWSTGSLKGKIFDKQVLFTGEGNNLELQVIGETSGPGNYKLRYKLDSNAEAEDDFVPGKGTVATTEGDNTVVIRVIKKKDEVPGPGPLDVFNINVLNRTAYSSYTSDSSNTAYADASGTPMYKRNVIFNIFNDNITTPKIIINKNIKTPKVDVNHSQGDKPTILDGNGYKINVKVETVETPPRLVKKVSTVIGREVN